MSAAVCAGRGPRRRRGRCGDQDIRGGVGGCDAHLAVMMRVAGVRRRVWPADAHEIRQTVEFHPADRNHRYVVEAHAPRQNESIRRHVKVPEVFRHEARVLLLPLCERVFVHGLSFRHMNVSDSHSLLNQRFDDPKTQLVKQLPI